MMPGMGRPGIILLREGTDTSQGKPQLISNINACQAVAEAVKTTLGPRGMDKLVFDGRKVTISNDGATIMALLEIAHPAAKTLVDISMSQDAEVGDGTTSVVLLAAEMLKQVKEFVEAGVHPQVLIRYMRQSAKLAVETVKALAVPFEGDKGKEMLLKCAGTALNSKLISSHQDLFAPMVVEAVSGLKSDLSDLNLIAVKKVPGGEVRSSFLVKGVAFKKTFSYAGHEQMTKKFIKPKILLLNVELELKSEKENAEVRITDPDQYQSIVDAEWSVIYEKLDKCIDSGANIVLSKLPIGDLATQYFADKGLFCAGRVEVGDMVRVGKATGAVIQTSTNGFTNEIIGNCGMFEEKQIGDERFNLFTECPSEETATIVLRGGSEQFIEESHRSMHDAIMVVKRSIKSQAIVAGGGAVEMEVAKVLRQEAVKIEGKGQLIMQSFARALEIVPRQLAENAGYDATDILNALRKKHFHEQDGKWFGVDIKEGGICDTYEANVWEPSINKINSLAAAGEAACVILSIDETVRNPKSEQPGAQPQAQQGRQGGGGMSGMMGNAMDIANGQARRGKLGQGVNFMKGRGGG